jgi:hypothetical protein
MRRRAPFVALAAVLLALVLAGCGGDDTPDTFSPPPIDTTAAPPAQGGGDDEGVRGGGGGIEAAKVGRPVPQIVGTTLDGKELDLADYRGKKVIVNLWSSW